MSSYAKLMHEARVYKALGNFPQAVERAMAAATSVSAKSPESMRKAQAFAAHCAELDERPLAAEFLRSRVANELP